MHMLSTLQILLFTLTIVWSERLPKRLSKYKICNRSRCKSVRSLSQEYVDSFAYNSWTNWSPCSRRCSTTRYRSCRFPLICGNTAVHEEAFCYHRGTLCEQIYTNSQTNFHSEYSDSDTDYSEYGNYDAADIGVQPSRMDYNYNYDFMDTRKSRLPMPGSLDSNVKRSSHARLPLVNSTRVGRRYSERTNPINQRQRLDNDDSFNGPFSIDDDSLEQSSFKTCGVARTTIDNSRGITLRILGGKESMKGRWPWQVAIARRGKASFC